MLPHSVLAGKMSSAGIASDIFHVIHGSILRKKGSSGQLDCPDSYSLHWEMSPESSIASPPPANARERIIRILHGKIVIGVGAAGDKGKILKSHSLAPFRFRVSSAFSITLGLSGYSGEGRPILFIHGFPIGHVSMTACMEPVFTKRKGYKRVYMDLPGMGLSET